MSKDPPDIRKRAYGYSLRAIKLYHALQEGKDGAGWVLGKQYLRAEHRSELMWKRPSRQRVDWILYTNTE